MSLDTFVEEKINHYAQMILDFTDKGDNLALGELNFYIALRRVMKGEGTTQDKGMIDAINDTLQEVGLLDKKKTFYK
ncbi:MAG: hypothetical protein AB8B69_13845 [Chitinophagales bacterium]